MKKLLLLALTTMMMVGCKESGRLGFSVTTPKKDDFTFGKGRTHYRIDNKIYKSKKKFLEALKEFSFKVVPIR